jgi:hypothetical protein
MAKVIAFESSRNVSGPGRLLIGVIDVYRDHVEAARAELLALRHERRVIDTQIASLENAVGSGSRRSRRALVRSFAIGVPAAVLVACAWLSLSRGFLCRIPKYHVAWRGAEAVQQAGEIWVGTRTCEGDPPCPRVDDLVQSKSLDPKKAIDPWGRPYRLACEEGSDRIWAYSLGKDGLAHTADDIASDMPSENLDAVAELSH